MVVGGAPDDFLAPVAEEVGGKDGGGFAAVIGGAALRHQQASLGSIFPVPPGNGGAVEQFAEQVAVPPDGEIAGTGRALGDFLAFGVEQAGNTRAKYSALMARITRIDVEGGAAPGTFAIGARFEGGLFPIDLAGAGVAEADAGIIKPLEELGLGKAAGAINMALLTELERSPHLCSSL